MTGPAEAFLAVCLNPTLQRTVTLDSLVPGEVNRGRRVRIDASGKGVNVARVLVQLGQRAHHLTHAGGDWREWFLQACASDGVNVVAPDSESEIRTCTTLLDPSAGTTTEIVEPTVPVAEKTGRELRDRYSEILPGIHTVILSGSIPAGYGDQTFPEMVELARSHGCRVIADFRGPALVDALRYGPDVIKPNLQEFVSTFFHDVDSTVREESDDPALLDRVRSEMLAIAETGTTVVLTRGSRPAMFTDGGAVREEPAEPVTAVNTIGCGDAFTAGLAEALYRQCTIQVAVRRGHAAAAQNAVLERPGAIRA